MPTCPSCGQENPDGARFCNACAAPLATEVPGGREERKLVTVLFCDLVGFTSRAETMDPEDVAALLAPYQARLKHELERHGVRARDGSAARRRELTAYDPQRLNSTTGLPEACQSSTPPSATGRASKPRATSTLAAIAARGPLSQMVTS